MSPSDDFGWRDRAVALASLGAAALSRVAFEAVDVIDEGPLRPVEMQVLVAVALQDSLASEPSDPVTSEWLSRALRLEQWVVEEIVNGLERAELVRRLPDPGDVEEIEDEAADESGEDATAVQQPVVVTELGLRSVRGWLARAKRHFGSWPPSRTDVDDVVG
jgi:hypothetical protein